MCLIADLYVSIPKVGNMVPRCKEYLSDKNINPDIMIYEELYKPETYPHLSIDDTIYLDSGFQFYRQLLSYNGLMLHASAVEMEGRAYLFSGQCGMGKSTHTRLWQQNFGSAAQVFNDDKPALRRLDGRWYAYGTPWCGKDGINQNKKVFLGGICFLKRGSENKIRRLSKKEAVSKILGQTIYRFGKVERLDLLLRLIEKLVHEIPVYELENLPEIEAAQLSYETMTCGAKEMGL